MSAPRRAVIHDAPLDRSSIAAHYDVSDSFYATFLDRRMIYTCAYFEDLASADLDAAQEAKLELVCRKLRIAPGERLLDIGCGWGGLAVHAATHHGARVEGVTLSRSQAAYARRWIEREGLSDLARVEWRDARTLEGSPGRYHKIAAVGVLEHIGIRHHGTFFRMVAGLLEPEGVFLNHCITNRPGVPFDASSAFMFRVIFPNAELAPISAVLGAMEGAGFEVHDVEDLRAHYHRTCTLWLRRLEAAQGEAIRHAGERTYRLWRLYLAGAVTAFEDGSAQVYQTVATRLCRLPGTLPATRRDLYAPRA